MESILEEKKHAGQDGGAQQESHIDRDQLLKYWSGELNKEEEDSLLSHAADCEECALLLAESISQGQLLTPRANLKQEILRKAREDSKNVIMAQGRFSPRFQMLTYSLKIGTAVAAALVLLFSFNPAEPLPSGRIPGQGFTGKMNQIMQDFSSNILDASNRLVSGGLNHLWDNNRIGGEEE